MKSVRAGQDAPPTVFEASEGCCTNSLHEPKKEVQSTERNRLLKKKLGFCRTIIYWLAVEKEGAVS